MPGSPIPETSGLTFKTYAVCWPQTDLWEGILAGMVTLPALAEFWDAETGSLDEVLDVGRFILNLNADVAESEIAEGCDKKVTQPKHEVINPVINYSSAGIVNETVFTVPSGEHWFVTTLDYREVTGDGDITIGFMGGAVSAAIRLWGIGTQPVSPVPIQTAFPPGSTLVAQASVTTPIYAVEFRLAVQKWVTV